MNRNDRIKGVLFGVAVGDSIGLPAEGVSAQRLAKWGWSDRPWKHRFLPGKGMWSDDTEHTFMVGNAILEGGDDAERFQRLLAGKLRWWFAGFPAGVGMATAKACVKLWLGIPPDKSGVFSAGNGPAMRSGVIGAAFPDDKAQRRRFVQVSTELTHTDPKALTAAIAVTETVAWLIRRDALSDEARLNWILRLREGGDEEWVGIIEEIAKFHDRPTAEFAASIGCKSGVTGYAYHTVPVALHAWLTAGGDFRTAVESAINCGCDTDTVAAIVGAIAGAESGSESIPKNWVDGLSEWPRSKRHLAELGYSLESKTGKAVGFLWPFLFTRNLLFLITVLGHGLIRIFR